MDPGFAVMKAVTCFQIGRPIYDNLVAVVYAYGHWLGKGQNIQV